MTVAIVDRRGQALWLRWGGGWWLKLTLKLNVEGLVEVAVTCKSTKRLLT
jgi:hypothetical protein